ncbi:MAG: hypothetical protein B6I19_00835 [Bacteroidetes bacterium 4572_114]|nr:MAG: hypothetical protein B6I19_00835 [Bacteroidetes bacterium 4572_114]
MKRINSLVLMLLTLVAFVNAPVLFSQEPYYDLKVKNSVEITPSKDIQRINSCWSNVGAALIEAEMIRSGKGIYDIAEMDFIHNAYILKAQAYLDSKGEIKVTEKGIPFDVFKLMDQYGMAPEPAYMKSDMNVMDKQSGEMDAIIRGTLRLVLEKENGEFTDRWQNTFDAALSKYIGDTKMEFKYHGKDYTPKSFAGEAGINSSDYIMLTVDGRQENYKPFVLELKNNWDKDEFFNVTSSDLQNAISSAIKNGYAVGWYGFTDSRMIYAEEDVAIVPAVSMPGQEDNDESTEKVFEPVEERAISDDERQKNFELLVSGTYNFLTLYGISEDKNGNAYIVGKGACEAGDETINMSDAFVKLNTVYVLLNKNGLGKELKNKLGL